MFADRGTKLLWQVVSLTLSMASVAKLGAQPRPAVPPATVYYDFDQAPPPAVLESIRAESEAIMGGLGIGLEWRLLAAARGTEVSLQLAVMRFHGRCDVSGLSTHRPQPAALGWTHESDGVVLPFGEIDCDRIRTFIQGDLLAVPARDREFVFGRAVGRVLAHELYHILARSPHHSSGGVGKAEYAVHDLLTARFVFDARASAELRTQLLRTAADEPPR